MSEVRINLINLWRNNKNKNRFDKKKILFYY